MSQLTSCDHNSNFRSLPRLAETQQSQQQLACDRCRGQKLRCIRARNLASSCERCQKAGAVCVINPSVRMGRPQRADKRRGETTNGQRKRQRATSPESSSLHQTSSQTSPSNTAKNELLWVSNDTEDTYGSHHANTNGVQYQDSHNLELGHSMLEDDPFLLFASEDCIDNPFDFLSRRVPLNLPFGMSQLGSEESLRQPSTFTSTQQVNGVEAEKPNTEDAPDPGMLHTSHLVKQALVEKVSNLNLELHRHLSVMSPTAKDLTMVEFDSSESMEKSKDLSAAIPFMVRGLQTFQELLLDTLGSFCQHSSKDTTSNTEQPNSERHPPAMQHTFWQNAQPCSTSLLSLTDGRSNESLSSSSAAEHNQEKTLPSDISSKPDAQNAQPQITMLDIPTSLLVISCYINLIHLCRNVFAAIRGSLLSPDHETPFATLSGFQISGISLHQDSDLQIIVLTQAVVRLVDRIGRSLGHPDDTASEGGGRNEDALCSRVILPELLDFVLRMEEIGSQRLDKGGIEALRDEIRKLNKVVYKPV